MKASELIPKLITRRSTGNTTVSVVLRFVKGGDSMKLAQQYLEPMYGPAESYVVIQHGDPDHLGDLVRSHQEAVRATFDLDAAILHMMELPADTQIRS